MTNEFSVFFPAESVRCGPGDYLVCRDPNGAWQVWQVEDLLLLKRLIPVASDPATLMVEEHLLDSVAPAYFNQVHLLVTAFEPGFARESDAIDAIRNRTLTVHARGLLRFAGEFRAPNCRVVTHTP
ncbi:MAG TPA: hypothetical protein VK864_05140 [Longimicrobiales bacterium]|nr:hypothetical protein [Longimicrobiales bacterium]